MEGRRFHPGQYLDRLEITYIAGYSLVVHGGRKEREEGWLKGSGRGPPRDLLAVDSEPDPFTVQPGLRLQLR